MSRIPAEGDLVMGKATEKRKGREKICLAMLIVFLVFIFTGLPGFVSDGNADNYGAAIGTEDELFFTILHTNDEHAGLIPRGPAVDYHSEVKNETVGGFARLATAVKQVREEKDAAGESTVLVSAGDHIGGTIFGWLTAAGYAAEIKLMQQIGYDLIILGNHEFDYGTEMLARYYKSAGYPGAGAQTTLLSSNVISPEGHPLNDVGLQRTLIKELDNGLRVGFFGLLGNDASNETPFFEPLKHLDAFETARECVDELQAQGADVIVAVTHSGIREDRELAGRVPGIHVIVGGHDHYGTEVPETVADTVIVQADSFVRYLGMLELAYSPATETVRVRNDDTGSPYLIPVTDSIPPHPDIDREVSNYTAELNNLVNKYTGGRYSGIMDTVAYSDFPLFAARTEMREMELGNFLTDAMRLTAGDVLGRHVDFAFQATGVIRAKVTPGTLPHSMHQISFYDLMGASPLGMGLDDVPGYPLAAAYLNGKEIHIILEISSLLSEYMGYEYFMQVSGLRYDYDRDRTIFFWIPGANIPVPSTSSVLRAERYTGEGLQTGRDEDYEPIPDTAGGDLYLVVTDYALLTAIPLVAERIPWLRIEPKDEHGNIVEDFADLKISTGGRELKVWQALLRHAANQPADSEGNPWVDEYYQSYGERIIEVDGPSIYTRPVIILAMIMVLITVILTRRRARRRAAA